MTVSGSGPDHGTNAQPVNGWGAVENEMIIFRTAPAITIIINDFIVL